jgi:hypothetical protein
MKIKHKGNAGINRLFFRKTQRFLQGGAKQGIIRRYESVRMSVHYIVASMFSDKHTFGKCFCYFVRAPSEFITQNFIIGLQKHIMFDFPNPGGKSPRIPIRPFHNAP